MFFLREIVSAQHVNLGEYESDQIRTPTDSS